MIAKAPLSWKKPFRQGAIIPHKTRNCSECGEDGLCAKSDKVVKQREEVSANLNETKRQAPNEFDHMLPRCKTNLM